MDEEEGQDQIQINLILDKWFALQQIIKEGITLNEISIILHIFTRLFSLFYSRKSKKRKQKPINNKILRLLSKQAH